MSEKPSGKLPPYLAVLSQKRQDAILRRAEEEGVPVEELQFAEGELDPDTEDAPEEQAQTAAGNGPETMRSGMLRSFGSMGLAVKSTEARPFTGKITAEDVAKAISGGKEKAAKKE